MICPDITLGRYNFSARRQPKVEDLLVGTALVSKQCILGTREY